MLPERSTTRVRFTDGRSSAASSRAVTATRTSWVPSSSAGAIPVSVRRARSASVGAGSSYGRALTHSSDRTDSAGGRRPSATSACATRNEPLSTSSANVDSGSMRRVDEAAHPGVDERVVLEQPGLPRVLGGRGRPPAFDEVVPAAPPWSPPPRSSRSSSAGRRHWARRRRHLPAGGDEAGEGEQGGGSAVRWLRCGCGRHGRATGLCRRGVPAIRSRPSRPDRDLTVTPHVMGARRHGSRARVVDVELVGAVPERQVDRDGRPVEPYVGALGDLVARGDRDDGRTLGLTSTSQPVGDSSASTPMAIGSSLRSRLLLRVMKPRSSSSMPSTATAGSIQVSLAVG